MEGYVKVAVVDNEFEAQLAAAVLSERGVPHFIKSYHDAAHDGLFQAQKGWGAIFAPPRFEAEVADVLASLRAAGDGKGGGAG